ncbi:MAG TPA: ABC transporter permease subunit [Vicinamibacterales bacterium]|nr:ABC transporter permease subunit [Vicinamibacterales bacterium]
MPIHRDRYRRREGGVDALGRAWLVIAANGLRILVRRRPFLFLMILAWIPAVVRAVQIYAAANVPSVSQVEFLSITPRMFRDFLNQQDPLVFFLTVYAGSGLIADDIRARALQLYLSRPVTRTQYIAGKAVIVMVALACVTWLPAMLLLFLVPVFAGNMTFVAANLFLIPAISAYSLIHITLSTFTILALSSVSKSRWFVAVMYAGLAFFTHAIFGVIGAAVEGTMFSWVSVFANVTQVGNVLFRMPPRYDTPPFVSAAVISAIIALSIFVLSRRIRPVEVVS